MIVVEWKKNVRLSEGGSTIVEEREIDRTSEQRVRHRRWAWFGRVPNTLDR